MMKMYQHVCSVHEWWVSMNHFLSIVHQRLSLQKWAQQPPPKSTERRQPSTTDKQNTFINKRTKATRLLWTPSCYLESPRNRTLFSAPAAFQQPNSGSPSTQPSNLLQPPQPSTILNHPQPPSSTTIPKSPRPRLLGRLQGDQRRHGLQPWQVGALAPRSWLRGPTPPGGAGEERPGAHAGVQGLPDAGGVWGLIFLEFFFWGVEDGMKWGWEDLNGL